MTTLFYEVKPTRRILYFILVVAAVLSSDLIVNGGVSWITILSASIMSSIILSQYMLIDIVANYIDKLEAKREFLDPLVENKQLRVKVAVKNHSLIPLFNVLVNDLHPNLFKVVSGSSKAYLNIPPRGSACYTYTVKPVIGGHVFEGLELIVYDLLGLFNYKTVLKPERRFINIKPQPIPIPRKISITWASRGLGVGRTRMRGIGQEFYALRDYQFGDEFRFIDWKSYARTRRLFVKEFVKEANLSIVFVLDATPSSMRGLLGETPLEYMARLVASLANSLIKRGDWVALTIRSSYIIRSGYGRGYIHYNRILDALSRIRWGSFTPYSRLGSILLEEALRIPRRSKTLFFTLTSMIDKAEAEDLVKAYNVLREKGHIVYVVLFQPMLFELGLLKLHDAGVYMGLVYQDLLESIGIRNYLISRGVNTVIAGRSTLYESIYKLIEQYRMVIT